MSAIRNAIVLAALAILVLPAQVPASQNAGGPAGPTAVPLWHDKPLRPIPRSPLTDLSPRVSGTAKELVLCVEFSDVKHGAAHTPAYFDNILDGPGNSMAAYYTQASTGVFTINANCSGWYTSSQTMAHYGAPNGGSNDNPLLYQLVTEAVQAADPYVNFADYDSNSDGWVDYLQVVHAGGDEAMTGNQNDIWSEMYYDFDTPLADGKKVGVYSMVSENDPMGVFAHEFGHQLGLPDLYDTDYTGSGGQTDGAGLWDIMAAGAYLGNGDVPSLPSAWCRALVGWADVVTVTADQNAIQLAAAALSATILRIDVPDIPNEYFLVENRASVGFDSYLPGFGLLIWHIDNSRGTVNLNDLENRPGKKRITLEEAHGGTQHLDYSGMKLYDPQDPWSNRPGGFSPTSDPNTTADLDGRQTFIWVRNIGPAGQVMSCDVVIDTPVYDLRLAPSGTQFNIDPGVTTSFSVELSNQGSLENYSFAVEGKYTDWFSVDPPWVRIGPRSSAALSVHMHPPVTAPAGTSFEDVFRATAGSDKSRSSSFKFTVKVNAKQRSVFGPSQDIELWPGETVDIGLNVSNQGNLADTVTMSLQGTGAGWVSYDGPTVFSLSAGSSTGFTLRAAIPFGTEQNARAYVVVGGRSKDGSASVQATLNLTARSTPYIEFEPPPEVHARPSVPVTVTVHLVNSGTADGVLALSTAADEGWWANLTHPNILIPAWGSEDVPVELTAPQGTPAGRLTSFNLTAAAGAYVNSTTIPVTVDQVFGAALEDCSTAAELLPGVQYDYRFTVQNTGNGPDELGFELIEGESGEGWSASIDSQALRLGAGAAATITVSVTAPASAVAGAQWLVRLSVSHADRETSLFDITSTVARLRSLSLSAATSARPGDPGDTLRFSISALNAGNGVEAVLFKVPKPDGLTLELSEPDYSFQPGERADLELTCRIVAGATAGVRAFNITAAARDDPAVNATIGLRVTVNAFFAGELQFTQTNQETPAGGTAVFSCTIFNRGNTKDTFTVTKISGTDDVRIDPPSVTLAPGASATINITIAISNDDAGGQRTVKVAARSQGAASEVAQKELTVDVPARPSGNGGSLAVPLAAAATVIVVAAVAAVFLLRRRKRAR
jgi:M6 family metalloprotease-like protein